MGLARHAREPGLAARALSVERPLLHGFSQHLSGSQEQRASDDDGALLYRPAALCRLVRPRTACASLYTTASSTCLSPSRQTWSGTSWASLRTRGSSSPWAPATLRDGQGSKEGLLPSITASLCVRHCWPCCCDGHHYSDCRQRAHVVG